jgi:hypothetical protein
MYKTWVQHGRSEKFNKKFHLIFFFKWMYKTWVQHRRSVKFNKIYHCDSFLKWMYKTWVQHKRSVKFYEFLGTNFKNMNVQKLGFNMKGMLSSMDASIWMNFFIKFGFNM